MYQLLSIGGEPICARFYRSISIDLIFWEEVVAIRLTLSNLFWALLSLFQLKFCQFTSDAKMIASIISRFFHHTEHIL